MRDDIPKDRWEVGVFFYQSPRDPAKRVGFRAYVRDFNPEWPRCCVHIVYADSGMLAKAYAIAQCRERCGK